MTAEKGSEESLNPLFNRELAEQKRFVEINNRYPATQEDPSQVVADVHFLLRKIAALTEAAAEWKEKYEKLAELEPGICKACAAQDEAARGKEEAEAREIVLRRNLENAYAEAQRIYPEFDWGGFTQTSEIIVMALYDKIKMLKSSLAQAERVIKQAKKIIRYINEPFIDAKKGIIVDHGHHFFDELERIIKDYERN